MTQINEDICFHLRNISNFLKIVAARPEFVSRLPKKISSENLGWLYTNRNLTTLKFIQSKEVYDRYRTLFKMYG